jgi:hypothetical protein
MTIPQIAPKKKVPTVLLVLIIIFALIIVGLVSASVALSNYQHKADEKTPDYYPLGGYAKTSSQVDPHLERRLTEQKTLLSTVNSKFKIDGLYNRTTLDNTALTSFENDGKPKPTDRTTVNGDVDYYLDPATNITDLNQTLVTYFKSEGFTITQDSMAEGGIEGTRNSLPSGSTAEKPKEELDVAFSAPKQNEKYAQLDIYDDQTTTYALSGIPVWDGMPTLAYINKNYSFEQGDPANHIKQICALPVNHAYGYWDKSFSCLASYRWR